MTTTQSSSNGEVRHDDAGAAMSNFVHEQIEAIVRLVDGALDDNNRAAVLGSEAAPWFERSNRPDRTANTIVYIALLNDVLHVAETAVLADGKVTMEEVRFIHPLARRCAHWYSKLKKSYADFQDLSLEQTRAFLRQHHHDETTFGAKCSKTQWMGLEICYRAAKETSDVETLRVYEDMMLRLMDGILALDEISVAEAQERHRIKVVIARKIESARPPDGEVATGTDPRIRAFCDPNGPEVFHAIAHQHEIWERDPFDVESIHGDARATFRRLLDRLLTGPQDRGRIALVLGGSGSGKTHLMRAFRAHVHSQRIGYAGYLQMSTRAQSYDRYVLTKLIDSLEHSYDAPDVEASGLTCISDALARATEGIPQKEIDRLRNEPLEPQDVGKVVSQLADQVVRDKRFMQLDVDLVRALLLLQRGDPAIKVRVLKYLRCEYLNAHDRELIGDIAPRTNDEDPLRMLEQLGRLMWSAEQKALVLLIDQLEDIFNLGEAKDRFPRAMDVCRHIVDHVPSSMVIVSCLQNFYVKGREFLTMPVRDRVEREPEPINLSSQRSLDEIEALLARRLSFLYDALSVRHHEDQPLFPFRRSDLEALTNLRTRDVLDWCRRYREKCMLATSLVELPTIKPSPSGESAPAVALEQRWNDFKSEHKAELEQSDNDLMTLLVWAIDASAGEHASPRRYEKTQKGWVLDLSFDAANGTREQLIIGLCNKAAQGGHLGKQIEELAKQAGTRRLVLLRCSEFPSSAGARVVKQIGEIIAHGGRRIVVEDADWRSMMAYQDFLAKHGSEPDIATWMRSERPLTQMKSLRAILGLEGPEPVQTPDPKTRVENKSAPAKPTNKTPSPAVAKAASEAPLYVGATRSMTPQPVELPLQVLTAHAAFLGSTRSGKTTLALNVIEQALMRRILVVLVDRKGDLCGYATEGFWSSPIDDPARKDRRDQLREQVEVRIFTPGDLNGRPLSLPIVPTGIAELQQQEASKVARYAASGLAAMMGYRDTQSDNTRLSILTKAIEVLGQIKSSSASINDLLDLLANEDPTLVNAIGRLDTKHFKKLIEHLQTLQLQHGELLELRGEELSAERLLSNGEKTSLSIISTKFLGDNARIEFWISRLLVEIGRYSTKKPSDQLQALFFFDEADIYLPASSKPATKEPMMDLLKRARSAGIGILLATQSPGDLDYRCKENIRTWFVGRVTQKTALEKMKPLFNDCRVNFSGRLATAGTGEFYRVAEGDVVDFKAARALLETKQLPEQEILALSKRELLYRSLNG